MKNRGALKIDVSFIYRKKGEMLFFQEVRPLKIAKNTAVQGTIRLENTNTAFCVTVGMHGVTAYLGI